MTSQIDLSSEQDSDYGPEFTIEEESILDTLVSSANEEAVTRPATRLAVPQDLTKVRQLVLVKSDNYGIDHNALHERPTAGVGTHFDSQRNRSSSAKRMKRNQVRDAQHIPTGKNDALSVANSEHGEVDMRSPLVRFRKPPRKPLSVTDIISLDWCELQYWYTLKYVGKKKRTPAMRQGSAMHKALEDQVHQTKEVSIESLEDGFALRILNVIQGLRTLRETGMTRELELWSTVDGEIVNGVIDELSYICPDTDLEGDSIKVKSEAKGVLEQATLTGPTMSKKNNHDDRGNLRSLRSMRKTTSKIYISDVKTRGHRSIPSGPSFRPTLYQLMLYHHMLSSFASGQVDFNSIAARYNLDGNAALSDGFIAQVGGLGFEPHGSSENLTDGLETPALAYDPFEMVLKYNSLFKLWEWLMVEVHMTMPMGRQSIGNVLKAEYRDRNDGSILGIKTFLFDEGLISQYIQTELGWWRGEREAQGVCIEEAYKCRSCDFKDDCEWRLSRVKATAQQNRRRTRSQV